MLEQSILNYKVTIEYDPYDNGHAAYSTFVSALGVSDFGSTIENAIKNTKKLIKFQLECLKAEGKAIPSPDAHS